MIDLVEVLKEPYPRVETKGVRTEYISPSRLCGCPRGAFMDSLGYPEPIGVASDMNMAYGRYRHQKLQKYFKEKGIILTDEEKVTMDDPSLMGFMDGRLKIPGGEAVLEIKTTGKPIDSILTPISYHVDQTLLYMHMTGLEKGVILYESRLYGNNGDIPWKQFEVDPDEGRVNVLLFRARDILEKLDKRELPLKAPYCRCRNPACDDKRIHRKEGISDRYRI